MRMRKLAVIPFLAACALVYQLQSTTARLRAESPVSAAVSARLERVENGLLPGVRVKGRPPHRMTLADRMRHYGAPGVSIAVINGGRIDWARGYGFRESGSSEPVTPTTLFQAGSISKPVAAMGALRLVQEGKLALDEDVNQRLVSWKVPENDFTREQKVTLRRLLSHTAGMTVHGFPGYASDATVPTLVQVLNGGKPANTPSIRPNLVPGSRWRYSGGGYCVMQQLVVDVTGKPFPRFMRETVLARLDMRHSTYEQPLPPARAREAATGYFQDGSAVPGKWHTYPEMAAAGLWTTPSDLARFAIEIQRSAGGTSRKVLSPEMTRQMLTRQINNVGVGLGLGLEGEGHSARFAHDGRDEGFDAVLAAYVEGGQGAVIMTNANVDGDLFGEILRSIASEYQWPDYMPKEREPATVDARVYDEYAGEYTFSGNRVFRVTAEGGCLFGQVTGESEKHELFPESSTRFFSETGPALTFIRDAEGHVTSAMLGLGGRRLRAQRVAPQAQ
jgi:CubicO group peptidase (beta-lactamase class C family)